MVLGAEIFSVKMKGRDFSRRFDICKSGLRLKPDGFYFALAVARALTRVFKRLL
jgi:hypothetical protein